MEGLEDTYGVIYSKDGKRLLGLKDNNIYDSYSIKDGAEVICDYAFYNSEIKDIVIPETVKAIGRSNFMFCKNLNTITFEGVVEEISKDAFIECNNSSLEIIIPFGTYKEYNEVLKGIKYKCCRCLQILYNRNFFFSFMVYY